MFPSPRTEWASVEQTICTPAASASRTCRAAEVEPVGQAVHLQRDAGLERDLEDPLQVERVLRPVVEDPALRVREACAAGWRIASTTRSVSAVAAPALAGVQADLHPFELGEHVVGEVERAVGEDVALAAAEEPERREQLVRGCDLLALPADVVGVEPGDDAGRCACGRRSRGTRSREPARRGPSPRPTPCRPRPSCARAARRGCRRLEQVGRRLARVEPRAARAAEREAERARRAPPRSPRRAAGRAPAT